MTAVACDDVTLEVDGLPLAEHFLHVRPDSSRTEQRELRQADFPHQFVVGAKAVEKIEHPAVYTRHHSVAVGRDQALRQVLERKAYRVRLSQLLLRRGKLLPEFDRCHRVGQVVRDLLEQADLLDVEGVRAFGVDVQGPPDAPLESQR